MRGVRPESKGRDQDQEPLPSLFGEPPLPQLHVNMVWCRAFHKLDPAMRARDTTDKFTINKGGVGSSVSREESGGCPASAQTLYIATGEFKEDDVLLEEGHAKTGQRYKKARCSLSRGKSHLLFMQHQGWQGPQDQFQMPARKRNRHCFIHVSCWITLKANRGEMCLKWPMHGEWIMHCSWWVHT